MMEWQKAIEGRKWTMNDEVAPEGECGAIMRQDDLYAVLSGRFGHDGRYLLSEEEVDEALNSLGVANTGWT